MADDTSFLGDTQPLGTEGKGVAMPSHEGPIPTQREPQQAVQVTPLEAWRQPVPPAEPDLLAEQSPTLHKFTAGLALVNPLSGAVKYGLAPIGDLDPDFNPIEQIPLDHPMDAYEGVMNQVQFDHVRNKIDAQRRDRRLSDSGAGLAGSIVGSIGSPEMLAGLVVAPYSVLAAVAAEAGIIGANEYALHQQQPERTIGESVVYVALGGTLAGAGTGLARIASRNLAAKQTPSLYEQFNNKVGKGEYAKAEDAMADILEHESTVGAMQAAQTSLMQEGMVTDTMLAKAAHGYTKLPQQLGASGSVLANSSSAAARRFNSEIQDLYITNKMKEGIADPYTFQSLMMQADADHVFFERAANRSYAKYLEAKGGVGAISKKAFRSEVSKAMSAGDTHHIPEVSWAAAQMRRIVSRKFDRAVDEGFLGTEVREIVEEARERAGNAALRPSDVLKPKGSKGYFPRLYKRELLLKNSPERAKLIARLKEVGEGVIYNAAKKTEADLAKADGMFKIPTNDPANPVQYAIIKPSRLRKFLEENPDAERVITDDTQVAKQTADEIAMSILNNIRGGDVDPFATDYLIPKAGSLNERTLGSVTDKELRDIGVIETDAVDVLAFTNREMTRELSMGQLWGGRDLKPVREDAVREFNTLIDKATRAGQDVTDLVREKGQVVEQIKKFQDSMLGTHQLAKDPAGLATNLNRWVRTFNTVTLLGGSALTNLTDVVAPALRHGLGPYLKNIGEMALNMHKFKGAYRLANQFGLACETVTGARLSALAETMDMNSKVQQSAMRIFGNVTGLNLITDASQTLGAQLSIKQINKMLLSPGGRKTKDTVRLASIGIGESDARIIAGELSNHGLRTRGTLDPRVALWENKEVAQVFVNAVRRDSRASILMPGITDRPLWMTSGEMAELGKMLGQFLTFPYMSVQRFMVAGLQRGDAEYLGGLVGLMAMAAVVDLGKSSLRGEDLKKRDAFDWVANAADRSGMFGAGGAVGLQAYYLSRNAINGEDRKVGRGLTRDFYTQAIGPGPQPLFSGIANAASLPFKDKVTENDVARALKAIPYANTLHAIDILNQLNGFEALGAAPSKRK